MKLINRFFGGKNNDNEYASNQEHCVIVYFKYGKENLEPLFELGGRLKAMFATTKIGDYDGHEIAVDLSDGMLYIYGRDADELFKAILPILESTDFTKGAKAKLRFGPPIDGVKEYFVSVG